MADKTTAQFMLERLAGEWGVRRAYGYPGDGINGLLGAFREVGDRLEFVQVRHEEIAAFAVVGQQARMSLGAEYQQEVDLPTLFKDVASGFVQVCMVPEQMGHLVDRAMRIAKATRSPTCIIVPNDVQELAYSEPPRAHGAVQSSDAAIRRPHVVPDDRALREAADVLNAGERVAMLIGQ